MPDPLAGWPGTRVVTNPVRPAEPPPPTPREPQPSTEAGTNDEHVDADPVDTQEGEAQA